jgi:hypothetical protein
VTVIGNPFLGKRVMQIEFSKAVERLVAKVKAMENEYRQQSERTVSVGYGSPECLYALFVHEDTTKRHTNGQAKYLEQPGRVYARQIGKVISEAVKAGKQTRIALLLGARFLLARSQELVPVDTGLLKSTGSAQLDGTGVKTKRPPRKELRPTTSTILPPRDISGGRGS